MKSAFSFAFCCRKSATFAIILLLALAATAPARERLLLDRGWRFAMGNAADPAKDFGYGRGGEFDKAGKTGGPGALGFNDSAWTKIDLPHDWVTELPFDENSDKGHGYKPVGRAYPQNSIGWYRRSFDIPKEDLGKRISVEFDGVYRDAIVWVNGQYLGRNLSGYAPTSYDLTDYLNYGGRNELVVRVDATEFEGWFYEGAGIYRHVWLVKTAPLHVPQFGVQVIPYVRPNGLGQAVVKTRVTNDGPAEAKLTISLAIQDASGAVAVNGDTAEIQLQPFESREVTQELDFPNPKLWSIESPNLYKAVASIKNAGVETDRVETPFGLRTIVHDPVKGLLLNDKPVMVKGTCNHQDHAGIGVALPDRVNEWRIEKLKEMGCNAYRTSHNPPTPELLDACDRLGMLVMDEERMMGSTDEALGQLERLIRRDRNHPSVFIWSIGNEEGALQGNDTGARIATTMQRLAHRLDPTRLCTVAMNGAWGSGFSNVIDVQGFNYKRQNNAMDTFRKKFPNKPAIGTEEASIVGTRGIYFNEPEKGYLSAYDAKVPGERPSRPSWASTAEDWWTYYLARPWAEGAFAWTGFDYRGEPTPFSWPCINSHFGIMDVCGFPKDTYYYYQAWWTDKPVLHLFPHWNWAGREGQEIEVWVHSNMDEVELLLNGASLGRKPMPRNGHLQWMVKYAPGTLEVKGFMKNKAEAAAMEKIETTGVPAAIVLTPDRSDLKADGEDVSMITVSALDAKGRAVATASNEISFKISQNGKILGVGNGDPSSHEPDKASKRHLFNGLAQVIVQSGLAAGPIELTAAAPGLKPATLTLNAKIAEPRPSVADSKLAPPTPAAKAKAKAKKTKKQ